MGLDIDSRYPEFRERNLSSIRSGSTGFEKLKDEALKRHLETTIYGPRKITLLQAVRRRKGMP
jgi:hypothetical protein